MYQIATVRKIDSLLSLTAFTGHIIQLNTSLYSVYKGEETLALNLFSRASSHWLTDGQLGLVYICPVLNFNELLEYTVTYTSTVNSTFAYIRPSQ
jgi:succinate-acetate transporter protein